MSARRPASAGARAKQVKPMRQRAFSGPQTKLAHSVAFLGDKSQAARISILFHSLDLLLEPAQRSAERPIGRANDQSPGWTARRSAAPDGPQARRPGEAERSAYRQAGRMRQVGRDRLGKHLASLCAPQIRRLLGCPVVFAPSTRATAQLRSSINPSSQPSAHLSADGARWVGRAGRTNMTRQREVSPLARPPAQLAVHLAAEEGARALVGRPASAWQPIGRSAVSAKSPPRNQSNALAALIGVDAQGRRARRWPLHLYGLAGVSNDTGKLHVGAGGLITAACGQPISLTSSRGSSAGLVSAGRPAIHPSARQLIPSARRPLGSSASASAGGYRLPGGRVRQEARVWALRAQ